LIEGLKLAGRIHRLGARRKQHGGAEAMRVPPLDGLHNKLLIARSAPTAQKEVWRNVRCDGIAIQRLIPLQFVVRIGRKDVVA
jgi:hypothetical protein